MPISVRVKTIIVGIARIVLAAIAILICVALAASAGRHGLARYAYGVKGANPTIADFERAIHLAADDPDPELNLANALADANRNQEAVRHCEHAVALRPGDEFSWLELGYVRRLAGDLEGACQDFSQAVSLAPYYGQPHWKLGKCLLDLGRSDEAYAELRTAVHRRPSYRPAFIRLVWDYTEGDPKAMEDAIKPNDSASNIAVANFLVEQKRWEDALHFYQQAGAASESYLHEMVRQFVAANRYLDAYKVWLSNHTVASDHCLDERGCIYDSSFENDRKFEDDGFSWSVAGTIDGVTVKIDDSAASSGKKSLGISFQGDSSPSVHVVSQLILVRPSSRYHLTFKAKTADLKSVALPVFSLIDRGLSSQVAESSVLPSGTTRWQDFDIEFTTSDHTDAVMLVLSRVPCRWSECPIFGTLWLDDFMLERR